MVVLRRDVMKPYISEQLEMFPGIPALMNIMWSSARYRVRLLQCGCSAEVMCCNRVEIE